MEDVDVPSSVPELNMEKPINVCSSFINQPIIKAILSMTRSSIGWRVPLHRMVPVGCGVVSSCSWHLFWGEASPRLDLRKVLDSFAGCFFLWSSRLQSKSSEPVAAR